MTHSNKFEAWLGGKMNCCQRGSVGDFESELLEMQQVENHRILIGAGNKDLGRIDDQTCMSSIKQSTLSHTLLL